MVAELHTWEQVDKLAANFEERFGYEPIWYGNVDEVYAALKESLDSGVPKLVPATSPRSRP